MPRVSDAKTTHDRFDLVCYRTETERASLVEFCRSELRKEGWREFSGADALRLTSGSLGFVKHAVELIVEIDFDPKLRLVGYQIRLIEPAARCRRLTSPRRRRLEAAKRAIDLERFPRYGGR